MNIETADGFRARVAKHAALADPARLRIVDLLTLGDFSRRNFRQSCGCRPIYSPTICAHWKRQGWQPATAPKPTGAAATSGLPPAPWRASFREPSAGPAASCSSARETAPGPNWPPHSGSGSAKSPRRRRNTPADRIARGAIEVARRHGVDLADLPPRRLEQVAGDGDFVVTVCDNAHEELAGLGGVHWSVRDPLRLGTEDAFEKAFDDIAHRINNLAPRVHAA